MSNADLIQCLVTLDRLTSEVDQWFVSSHRRGKKRETETMMLLLELRSLARRVTIATANDVIADAQTRQLAQVDFEGCWIQ